MEFSWFDWFRGCCFEHAIGLVRHSFFLCKIASCSLLEWNQQSFLRALNGHCRHRENSIDLIWVMQFVEMCRNHCELAVLIQFIHKQHWCSFLASKLNRCVLLFSGRFALSKFLSLISWLWFVVLLCFCESKAMRKRLMNCEKREARRISASEETEFRIDRNRVCGVKIQLKSIVF